MEKKKEKKRTSPKKELFEWLDALIFTAMAVVLIFTFVFRVVWVNGESMLPTLENGDGLVITSYLYEPENGDVVVSVKPNYRNEPLVKRVIGTAGDEIDINFETGDVYRNGELLEEDYINTPTNHSFDVAFPVTVPDGCVFLMGDNRNASWDSRSGEIGMVNKNHILGKAVFRFRPFTVFEWMK